MVYNEIMSIPVESGSPPNEWRIPQPSTLDLLSMHGPDGPFFMRSSPRDRLLRLGTICAARKQTSQTCIQCDHAYPHRVQLNGNALGYGPRHRTASRLQHCALLTRRRVQDASVAFMREHSASFRHQPIHQSLQVLLRSARVHHGDAQHAALIERSHRDEAATRPVVTLA